MSNGVAVFELLFRRLDPSCAPLGIGPGRHTNPETVPRPSGRPLDGALATMRLAVAGAHRVGKTSLAHAIIDALPNHEFADEPYHELVAEGYGFGHPPGVSDFEAQLDHSITMLRDYSGSMVFDRCPLDILAYLTVVSNDDGWILGHWRAPVRISIRSLDAIIYVPIEVPDRIESGREDDVPSRAEVDEVVREMLEDPTLTSGVEVLTVVGDLGQRLETVLQWVKQRRAE